MKKNYFLILLFFVITINFSFSTIRNVPANYSTIQSAINASVNGDTVVVAPGTYFENINFKGRNIVVTSQYYLAQNVSFINSTIINGSTPLFPDTASCVVFNHGETAAALLQGFTLTGGGGSKWLDIHGAGTYREGGGILIELSSPTIKHNLIVNNLITNTSGVTSTGGGGIRVGDGNPTICSNAIMFNQAKYGPGVVLNYTGVKLTNNVIASNSGGVSYNGGSGIWAINNFSATPIIIENNTVVNNYSALAGGTGGILIWGCNNTTLRNNIVYGNTPMAAQVKTITVAPTVIYNNIESGYTGTGNISQNPLFASNNYFLATGSPCIDAGDPNLIYNDIEDQANLGNALFPSLALLHNDMGAFGGPCASNLPTFASVTNINEQKKSISSFNVFPNPSSSYFILNFKLKQTKTIKIEILNMIGQVVKVAFEEEVKQGENSVKINNDKLAGGTYFVRITGNEYLNETVKLIITD